MTSHVLVFFSRSYFGLCCYNIINTTVLSYANLKVKKNYHGNVLRICQ